MTTRRETPWQAPLRTLLRRRALTHAALADELGISRQAVGKWLYGERQPTGLYAKVVRDALVAAGITPPKEGYR